MQAKNVANDGHDTRRTKRSHRRVLAERLERMGRARWAAAERARSQRGCAPITSLGADIFKWCVNNMRREKLSQPISRVLSGTIIHLQPVSPQACSGLPESNASSIDGFLFGLAPSGVYTATNCYQSRGALLPHLFTLTESMTLGETPRTTRRSGGLFSAALAVGSRLPGVTWHPALWSPDFPLNSPSNTARR